MRPRHRVALVALALAALTAAPLSAQVSADPALPPDAPAAGPSNLPASPTAPPSAALPPAPASEPSVSTALAPASSATHSEAQAAQSAAERRPPVELAWGRGLTTRSDDGAFSLQRRARIQALALFEAAADGAEPEINFAVRRARFAFRGSLASPDLQFYVQLGLAPRDMESDLLIPLRDASIAWTGWRDLNLRAGIMKVPFNRERVISSSALQLVDRSILNAELTLDRDQGIQLSSNDLFGLGGVLGYQLGVFTGDGRLRVNEGTGLLYVARLQVQPLGEFEDSYSEADLTRDARPRLSIGAGFAWNQATPRERSTTGGFYQLGGFDYAHAEVDLMFKVAGFSLMGEFLYREATGPSERTGEVDGVPVVERARNAIGWMVQAGYLFDRDVPIELAARYADVQPIGAVSAVQPLRELVVGLNWYPIGHDLKLQLDYGYTSSSAFEDGTHRVRLQTQAYF